MLLLPVFLPQASLLHFLEGEVAAVKLYLVVPDGLCEQFVLHSQLLVGRELFECFVFEIVEFVAEHPHLLILVLLRDLSVQIRGQLPHLPMRLLHLLPHDLQYFLFVARELLLDVGVHLVDEAADLLVGRCDLLFVSLQGRLGHLLEESHELAAHRVLQQRPEGPGRLALALLLVRPYARTQQVH